MSQTQHNRKIIPEGVGFSRADVYKRPFSACVRWSFRGARPGCVSRIFVFVVRPPSHRIRAKRALWVRNPQKALVLTRFSRAHGKCCGNRFRIPRDLASRSAPRHAGGRHPASDLIRIRTPSPHQGYK